MRATLPDDKGTFNSFLVLLIASAGCAMTVLDTNIVAVVLPTVAQDLGATFAEVEWVISSYVLCFASLLLPAGAIADRYGRRCVFLMGIALFAATSLLCGLATSAKALYAARALQGIGAAFLLAPALAIIGHTFHGEAERGRAWAIWGAIMGLTMVLAPIIGGIIAFSLGWRWAFHINVPICILLASAVLLFVGESKDSYARRLDPAGIVFFATAMFGFTSGLINGQAHGWATREALAGFAGGAISLFSFIVVEELQDRPMLDLTLLRSPRFGGAVLAMTAYASCAQVMASLLPLYLQNGLGKSPLEAGFAMLPFALAMLVLPQIGRLLGRYLISWQILVLGLCVVAIGNAVTGWGASLGSWLLVIVGMIILGSGGGLLNGETQKAIMGSVPRDRSGMASGISTTSRFSGILLGFATLSGVLGTATRTTISRIGCGGANWNCVDIQLFADSVVAGDIPHALADVPPFARDIVADTARLAYSNGFAAALVAASVIAGFAALFVWILMREKPNG
jgi:EmrB/QacA subfamily drug resistance transporter